MDGKGHWELEETVMVGEVQNEVREEVRQQAQVAGSGVDDEHNGTIWLDW